MDPELRVASTCGLRDGDEVSLNAYLGVSFSKTKYFSSSMVQRYILWACEQYHDLLIIVADHLEVYNAQVFKGLSYEEAEAATLKTGLQYKRAYEKVCPANLASRVDVRLASEILADAACRELLDFVKTVSVSEPTFAADLRKTVHTALSGKLAASGLTLQAQDSAIDILQHYMIEEIAIILYITCRADHRYHVSIFPYRPPQILLDIYSGRYKEIFSAITEQKPYRAVELVA